MKKLLWISALCLLASACQNDEKPPSATGIPEATKPAGEKSSRKTILFFGNSLTAAYQLAPEEGFPNVIQQKIDALGLPYQCVNAGVSGETTADGANRIRWVSRQPIDIFVLELGANDALRGLELKESKKNLETIIKSVQKTHPDCQIVVAGMMAPPNLGEEYTVFFKEMFFNLANKYKCAYVPFLLEGVAANPELNLEDGIHPNAEGYKIVADNVWKVLQPLLSE